MNNQEIFNKTYVGIMAGGIGSRFWPESRSSFPKQFLDILGIGRSLLQITFERMLHLAPLHQIYIITSVEYAHLVREQIPTLPEENILKEPLRKNTAPCIAYFSHKINSINPDSLCVIAPSDHVIIKETEYLRIQNLALEHAAKENILLTLGILPTRPDTGYGYIQFVEEEEKEIYKVKTFTEKPNLELAKEFVRSGEFLWNSGMFVWQTKAIMEALDMHMQEMHQSFFALKQVYNTSKEKEMLRKVYEHCNNISIDYGIMEKAENVYVIPANIGWSDLGTWGSLYDYQPKDYYHNVVKSKNVIFYDSTKNIVMSPDKKLLVIQGLNDYIIVDTPDVLLICPKNQEQQIKEITNDIKKSDWNQYL